MKKVDEQIEIMMDTRYQEAKNPTTGQSRLRILAKHSVSLACHVAQNPSASPALLEELFLENGAPIAWYLVKNPNTPLSLLFSFAEQFPKEFLENPVLTLLLIEDPDFIKTMPTESLLQILRLQHVPEVFLEKSAEGEREVQQALFARANLSQKILYQFSTSTFEAIRQKVAEHSNTPLNALETLADDKKRWIRQLVARHPKSKPSLLEKLSRDQDEEVRREVARRKITPGSVLIQLAEDRYSNVRHFAAKNPNMPQERLALLQRAGCNKTLGKKVKPSTSLRQKELEILANGGPWARILLSLHPNTPLVMLTTLAKDPERDVRASLLQNPRLSDTLKKKVQKSLLNAA